MPASVNLNPPQMLPPSPSASSSAHWFNTYAALAAGGVVFALAVLLLWRMYKLTVSARPQPQDMAHVLPSFSVPGDGPAVDVAALPVFVVRADDAAVVECAVCLAEVREGERGRLLPRCGHGFHVECIDRWFGANSTCPVCRAVAIVGQPDDVEACKGGGPAPVGVVEQS